MPIETTKNYIEIRINATKFKIYRIINIDIGKGIKARIGKNNDSDKMTTTHFLFNKERWTLDRAKKWVTDHGHAIKSLLWDIEFAETGMDKYNEILKKEDEDYEEYKTQESDFMEIKYFNAEIKIDEKESTEDMGIFRGHANTWDMDEVDDIAEKGSFNKTLREHGKKRALFFMHSKTIADLMGAAVNLKQDDVGLAVRGELELEFEECRKAYRMMQKGIIDRMSIGFRVVKCTYEKIKDRLIRHIQEMQLMEISLIPVAMAANQRSLITDVKSVYDLILFIKQNKNDEILKHKILSLYGYEPEKIETTHIDEPDYDSTPMIEEPKDNNWFKQIVENYKGG